ncbi:hypothetical protein PDM23_21575, partial [Bacillus cereus group sp. Bcc09]|nr:hypothetical protein [Bacillus cereus group sp. Bcc09]
QGLFDVPTFITSIKDNKKLRGKTAFYIKIYVKLMDVGSRPMPINLRKANTPKRENGHLQVKMRNFFVLGAL